MTPIILDPSSGEGPTFLDLQDEVLNHGFPELYRPRVKAWLNEAQQVILRRARLRTSLNTATITTVVGQESYSLPTGFMRVLTLSTADGVQLPAYADVGLLRERPLGIVHPNDALANTGYALGGDGLYLSPVPTIAQALTLTYYGVPLAMEGDEERPSVPPGWEFVLISYALSRAFRSRKDWNAASQAWQQFQSDLNQLTADRRAEANVTRQVVGMMPRGY
jgi:hypothetical protein